MRPYEARRIECEAAAPGRVSEKMASDHSRDGDRCAPRQQGWAASIAFASLWLGRRAQGRCGFFDRFGRADLVTFVHQTLSSPVLQKSENFPDVTKPALKFAHTDPSAVRRWFRTMSARQTAEIQSLALRRPFRGRRCDDRNGQSLVCGHARGFEDWCPARHFVGNQLLQCFGRPALPVGNDAAELQQPLARCLVV
jgi:hypothetical protein